MELPQQLQAQVKRVKEIEAAMTGTAPPAPAPEPAPPAPAPIEPPAPAPAPIEAPAPAPATATSKQGESGDAQFWMHKYSTLQGMYNQLTVDHRQLAQDTARQLGEMASQIATLRAAPPATAPAPAGAVTEDDRRVLGDTLVDFVPRAAKAALAPEIQAAVEAATAPLKQANAELQQQLQALGGQVAAVHEEDFFDKLDRELPGWEDVNRTEPWLRWLGGTDDMTGYPRQALLEDAISKKNLNRVKAMFAAFGFTGTTSAPTANSPAPAPAPSVPDLSPAPRTVGSQVVPSRRADEETGPLVTRAEIATFYNEVAQGKYRTRPDAKKAMDEKIALAVRTGRVG